MRVRGMRTYLVIVALIAALLASISFVNLHKETTIITVNNHQLMNSIAKLRNEDGGFSNLSVLKFFKPDVYTSYYALEIKNLLALTESEAEYQEILKYYKDNEEDFYRESKVDNLSNLFYISSMMNKINSKEHSGRIIEYVLNLQNDEGSFGFSNKHNETIKIDKRNAETFLSTYLALSTLELFGEKPRNIENLHQWIEKMFADKEFINDSELVNVDYLFLLIKISEISNFDLSKYGSLIQKLSTSFNNQFKKRMEENTYSIFDINSILDLNKLIPTNNKLSRDEFIKLSSKLNSGRRNNGLFSINSHDQGNILPTYYAIKIASENKLDFNYKGNMIDTLERYKIKGGYREIIEIPSTTNDTYYAFKIEQIMGVDDKKEYTQFVMDYPKSNSLLKPQVLNSYLKLRKELGLENDFGDKDKILQHIEKNILNFNETQNYDLLYNLENITMLNGTVKSSVRDGIYQWLQKTEQNTMVPNKIVDIAVEIEILNELKFNDSELKKQKLEQLILLLGKSNNIEPDVYSIIEIYKNLPQDIEISTDMKESIIKVLRKNQLEDGFFTVNQDVSSPSYYFTYNALFFLKKNVDQQ